MIGDSRKNWNSLHNLVVPSVVACIEASWMWAWINAFAHIAPGVQADIPYLAIAIPAVLAVALWGYSVRLGWPNWCRAVALPPVVLLTTLVSAGAIGSLYLHGAFIALSTHPWSITGSAASNEAALACFIAVLAVGRGTWLGWTEMTGRHAVNAVGISALGFMVFFIVTAVHRRDASFHPGVGLSVALLLASFPAAVAVIALVNERELERATLPSRQSGFGVAGLGAVVIPMACVAALGALVAFVIASLTPFHTDLAHWLTHRSHGGSIPIATPTTLAPFQSHGSAKIPLWTWIVSALVAAALVGVVVRRPWTRPQEGVGGPRRIDRRHRRRRRYRRPSVLADGEERESLFSWRHLFRQLFGLIKRLLSRRSDRTSRSKLPPVPTIRPLPDPDSVRDHYRRVLLAARSAGHGREATETPAELRDRLLSVTSTTVDASIRDLTALYEHVRYGGEPDSEVQIEHARQDAEALVTALVNGNTAIVDDEEGINLTQPDGNLE